MAKANLDVPIVPDSSTPRIDANAPKVSINPPIIERVGEKLSALVAARLKGAVEAARLAWSTIAITTTLVIM
jgi:hypothetical protein